MAATCRRGGPRRPPPRTSPHTTPHLASHLSSPPPHRAQISLHGHEGCPVGGVPPPPPPFLDWAHHALHFPPPPSPLPPGGHRWGVHGETAEAHRARRLWLRVPQAAERRVRPGVPRRGVLQRQRRVHARAGGVPRVRGRLAERRRVRRRVPDAGVWLGHGRLRVRQRLARDAAEGAVHALVPGELGERRRVRPGVQRRDVQLRRRRLRADAVRVHCAALEVVVRARRPLECTHAPRRYHAPALTPRFASAVPAQVRPRRWTLTRWNSLWRRWRRTSLPTPRSLARTAASLSASARRPTSPRCARAPTRRRRCAAPPRRSPSAGAGRQVRHAVPRRPEGQAGGADRARYGDTTTPAASTCRSTTARRAATSARRGSSAAGA